MKLFFLFLSTLTLLFSQNYKEIITETKLYQHSDWISLLHFKDGKSEIDDPLFFLSEDGKTNPKAELFATVDTMLTDSTDDDNSTICIYPARHKFLQENLPEIAKNFPQKRCEKLNEFLKEIDPQSITLSFPTAHINSPASMFGHTLLRVNSDINSSLV